MDSVIVLGTADLGKEGFLLVGLQVSILISHDPDVVSRGDNDLVTQNTDSMNGIDFATLIEDGGFVSLAISAGVFKNENTVSLRALVTMAPVVDDLANPHPTKVVNINAGGA